MVETHPREQPDEQPDEQRDDHPVATSGDGFVRATTVAVEHRLRGPWELGHLGWMLIVAAVAFPFFWISASWSVPMEPAPYFLEWRATDVARSFAMHLFFLVVGPVMLIGVAVTAGVPGWIGLGGAVVGLVALALRRRRRCVREFRAGNGRCAACDHQLDRLQARCPECGAARMSVPPPAVARQVKFVFRSIAGIALGASAASLVHHEYMAATAASYIIRTEAAVATGQPAARYFEVRWAEVDFGFTDPLLWFFDSQYGYSAGQG